MTTYEKGHGPDHLQVANALEALAGVHAKQGDDASAEPLYRRALTIREKALGPEHPEVAELRADYAELLRRMGRHDEATDLKRQTTLMPVPR